MTAAWSAPRGPDWTVYLVIKFEYFKFVVSSSTTPDFVRLVVVHWAYDLEPVSASFCTDGKKHEKVHECVCTAILRLPASHKHV